MEVLVFLVPMALALGLLGLFAFLWSLKAGQYDDLEGAGWRAIMDEDNEQGARATILTSEGPGNRAARKPGEGDGVGVGDRPVHRQP